MYTPHTDKPQGLFNMTFERLLEYGIIKARQLAHLNPLQEFIWECNPLLVINDQDEIAFYGTTNVAVTPHAGPTAALVAEADRDGWRPALVNAQVEAGDYGVDEVRQGYICSGHDSEGLLFTWYIDGAAESYFAICDGESVPSTDSKIAPLAPPADDEAVG
jgi:hypothetical protein